MTIYAKLVKARKELQDSGLKKTGNNQKFTYFELSDFLPKINELSDEIGFCCIISYGEIASMKIFDTEKPENFIEIASPMASAKIPNAQDIQNLGAVQSYMRRYLYLTAFEIAENDLIEGNSGNKKEETNISSQKIDTKNHEEKTEYADAKKNKELKEQLDEIMKDSCFTEQERKDVMSKRKKYAEEIANISERNDVLGDMLEQMKKRKQDRFDASIPFENDIPEIKEPVQPEIW